MKQKLHPITDENFSLAWEYANKKLEEFKKKSVIRMLLKVFSNLTFLFCMTGITYDALQ